MVYCTKCGALNADDAKVCVQCGAPLYGAKEESSPYWRHRHMRYEGEYYGYYRRRGAIATMILGLIIIFIGFLYLLSVLYDVSIPWRFHPCARYRKEPQVQAISPCSLSKQLNTENAL